MNIATNLTFIHDPGHGWLRVPLRDIAAMGVETQISRYSYAAGSYAYLEEDCDYAVYADACAAKGIKLNIESRYMNRFDRDRMCSFAQIKSEFWANLRPQS